MILLVKIAAGFAGLYLLVVVLVALAQDWLSFPRWAMGHGAAALPASAERLALEVASGEELVGVHLPAEVRPSAESALILGSEAMPGAPIRSPFTSSRSFRTGTSWLFTTVAMLPAPDVPAQLRSFRTRFRSTITWLAPFRLTGSWLWG